jgi:hypothetical protein
MCYQHVARALSYEPHLRRTFTGLPVPSHMTSRESIPHIAFSSGFTPRRSYLCSTRVSCPPAMSSLPVADSHEYVCLLCLPFSTHASISNSQEHESDVDSLPGLMDVESDVSDEEPAPDPLSVMKYVYLVSNLFPSTNTTSHSWRPRREPDWKIYWRCAPEVVQAEADAKIALMRAEHPDVPVICITIYHQVAQEQWEKIRDTDDPLVAHVLNGMWALLLVTARLHLTFNRHVY